MPRLVECTAKIASGIIRKPLEEECPAIPRLALQAVSLVGNRLVYPRDPPIYCMICMHGPYTRKGYYLHLRRMHSDYIKEELSSEIERLEAVYRGQLE